MRRLGLYVVWLVASCSDSTKPVTTKPTAPITIAGAAAAAGSGVPASTAAITQLAVGSSHTCALHADGTVSCWGLNTQGQLGIEKLDRSLVPIGVPGVRDAIALTAAEGSTCVRKADDTVHCWGHIGNSSDVHEPAQLTADVVQMAGRCFRMRAGTVECLTANAQLVPIEGVEGALEISANGERGCALLAGGKVACWLAAKAHAVPNAEGARNLVSDAYGGCAVFAKGAVKCWTFMDMTTLSGPFDVHPGPATELIGGGDRLCARIGGKLECWKDRNVENPLKLDVADGTVIAPGSHSCVARGGRNVQCWGFGLEGQLGNGWWQRRPVPTRIAALDGKKLVQLAAANRRMATCARSEDGKVWCWGMLPTVQQAKPIELDVRRVKKLVDSETLRFIDMQDRLYTSDYYSSWKGGDGTSFELKENGVKAASDHCFVKLDGRLRCWKTYLAVDPKEPAYTLTPKIADAVDVDTHSEQGLVCARRAENKLSCFRLGSDVLSAEGEVKDALAIEVGDSAQCAIRPDRSLWCWGSSQNAIFTPRKEPIDVPPTKVPVGEVVAMSMMRDNICVVKPAGTVACWGANSEGQLGDGTFLPRDRAADVIGISDAIDVHVGLNFACALHRDGGVSCWGASDRGQIGTYAMISVDEPTNVVWP